MNLPIDETEATPIQEQDLVDTRIAGRILGLSTSTMVLMRQQKRGPNYYKIGPKTVRYSMEDLNKYVEHKHVDPHAPCRQG